MLKKDKVVAYFYDEEVGNFCYGGGNPMRPHRVRLTHSLVHNYGLTKQLVVHRPKPRTFEEITEFHADEYVDFLKTVTPDNQDEYMAQLRRFNMGVPGEADCPVFDGLYTYCQVYSGGSVDGATLLANQQTDIALNWSGGMHHAKKAEASGFCYINDIVLAILELLKVYARVLYVDIDIHHGDGVEEAFYLTDRVMTVSFHKYGDFFPGTGALEDIGINKGKCYTINVPLKEGMDDESYRYVFEPVMAKVMETYQPGAIVVCAGADSLSGDRLGCFNLSLEGHSNCLEFLAKFNVPMLVLGGGGYTMRNVARCWCYETGRLMGVDLPDGIPDPALSEYNYYLDTQRLRIAVSNMRNANTIKELEAIKIKVLENIRNLPACPSVPFKHLPAVKKRCDDLEEEMDARGGGQLMQERRRIKEEEDSDDEEPHPGRQRHSNSWIKEEVAASSWGMGNGQRGSAVVDVAVAMEDDVDDVGPEGDKEMTGRSDEGSEGMEDDEAQGKVMGEGDWGSGADDVEMKQAEGDTTDADAAAEHGIQAALLDAVEEGYSPRPSSEPRLAKQPSRPLIMYRDPGSEEAPSAGMTPVSHTEHPDTSPDASPTHSASPMPALQPSDAPSSPPARMCSPSPSSSHPAAHPPRMHRSRSSSDVTSSRSARSGSEDPEGANNERPSAEGSRPPPPPHMPATTDAGAQDEPDRSSEGRWR